MPHLHAVWLEEEEEEFTHDPVFKEMGTEPDPIPDLSEEPEAEDTHSPVTNGD